MLKAKLKEKKKTKIKDCQLQRLYIFPIVRRGMFEDVYLRLLEEFSESWQARFETFPLTV